MAKFLNPYQFLPVPHASQVAEARDVADGKSPNIRHDAWQPGTRSGRIVCSLTAESPLMVGGIRQPAEQKADAARLEPYRLEPYRRDGRPAIPGNSLRGVVGSVLEYLSSSSLRVLRDESYFIRENGTKKDLHKTAHQHFKDINADLLPWSGGRESLTRAETMLGVVSGDKPAKNEVLPALASRIRFFDATLAKNQGDEVTLAKNQGDEVLMGEVKLQILASPKPPCPSMYFSRGNNTPISKTDLISGDEQIRPAGRKIYLHHPRAIQDGLSTAVSNTQNDDTGNKQRVKIRPVRKGTRFLFHVDFENLTDGELRLLFSSLAPGKGFLHKIGMGKPLGLGSVGLTIEAVAIFDRTISTYSPPSLTKSATAAVYSDSESPLSEEVQSHLSNGDRRPLSAKPKPLKELKKDNSHVNDGALEKLKTAGSPEEVEHEVCYPRTCDQFTAWSEGHQEDKLYEWFTRNERADSPQKLKHIAPRSPLPPLETN